MVLSLGVPFLSFHHFLFFVFFYILNRWVWSSANASFSNGIGVKPWQKLFFSWSGSSQHLNLLFVLLCCKFWVKEVGLQILCWLGWLSFEISLLFDPLIICLILKISVAKISPQWSNCICKMFLCSWDETFNFLSPNKS